MRTLLTFCGLLLAGAAMAGAPLSLPFQARLSGPDGSPVPDSPHNVRLSVFNGPDAPQAASETFTVSGDTITLSNAPVVVNSETVKKTDNTATYTRGIAYTVDYVNGVIRRSSATAIPDGTVVVVTYQWTPRSLASVTQTVDTRGGLFTTSVPVPSATVLTGSDWVQVEVDRGGTWETLSPRLRLYSAPYALQVGTVHGATGGDIAGDINLAGSLTTTGGVWASGTVSGQGSSRRLLNFPLLSPGVEAFGAYSLAGEAPAIHAVGARNGTGTALQAEGSADVTGSLSVHGPVTIGTPSAGTVSAATMNAGTLTADTVNAQRVAVPNGVITGNGILAPDYDSGLRTMAADKGNDLIDVNLAPYSDPTTWIFDLHAWEPGYNNSLVMEAGPNMPGMDLVVYTWNRTTYTQVTFDVRRTTQQGDLRYRLRVWRPVPPK